MKNIIIFIIILILNFCSSYTFSEADNSHVICLDGKWKYSVLKKELSEGDNEYFKMGFDDSKWKEINIPLNISRESAKNYFNAWFRSKFTVPIEDKDKRGILKFEGAGYETDVWVNGEYIGKHRGAYTHFEFEITKYLKFGEENIIAVKCINSNVYPHSTVITEWMPNQWAIWQPVKLFIEPKTYISRVYINPKLDTSTIEVKYCVDSANSGVKKYTLEGTIKYLGSESKENTQNLGEVYINEGTNDLKFAMKMDNPLLWGPDSPNLYNLTLNLKNNNEIIDSKTTRFGFREFLTKGKYFYLNGKQIKLFGLWFIGGSSIGFLGGGGIIKNKEAMKKELMMVKNAGCNLTRYFYPMPQNLVEAADEVGILVYQQWGKWLEFEKKYMDSNIEEMKEWLVQLYNNPSIVMISLVNENWSNVKQESDVYDALKPIIGDKMQICASAGLYSFIGHAKEPAKTDFIDFHNYIGNSSFTGGQQKLPWTYFKDSIEQTYNNVLEIYKNNFNKPLIVGEYAGQTNISPSSNPFKPKVRDMYKKDVPKAYVLVSQDNTSQPIAYDITQGPLEDIIKGIGNPYGYSFYYANKRLSEVLRTMNELVQGMIPNWGVYGDNMKGSRIFPFIFTPVFVCLNDYDSNVFTGTDVKLNINVINDTNEDITGAKISVNIENVSKNGIKVKTVKAMTKEIINYVWKVPDDLNTGYYKVILEVIDKEEKVLCKNEYDFYVLNKKEITNIKTDKKVGVFLPEKVKKEAEKTLKILNKLGIRYTELKNCKDKDELASELDKIEVLIIPSYYNENIKNWKDIDEKLESFIGRSINAWVIRGGRLLSLEQSSLDGIPWLEEWNITDGGVNTFIDMALPKHPVFNGLTQNNFDTWNGNKGVNNRYLIIPMTENVIASSVALQTVGMSMALAEAKIGKGSILMSQAEAVERFGNDSSATKYLHNVLTYLLSSESGLWSDIRGIEGQKGSKFSVNYEKCFYVNLKPYTNQGFQNDGKDRDKWSGWTDQAENDLRHIPKGEDDADKRYWDIVYYKELKDKQIFLGVPFEVIDPKNNNGKGCIVLRGADRDYFPEKVEGIEVNRKLTKLYFLHTSAWAVADGETGKYIINYEDGDKQEIVLKNNKNIADWWGPKDKSDAKVGWSGKNPASHQLVGVYIMEWNNPKQDKIIKTIDFVSESRAVPVLIAITGTFN